MAFAAPLSNANAALESSGQESNTQALAVQAGFADKQFIVNISPSPERAADRTRSVAPSRLECLSTFSGAGAGMAQGGAAAGFPLPALRYVVGGGDNTANASTANSFESLSPRDGASIPTGATIDFAWAASPRVAFYRLEIEDETGRPILSAMLKSAVRNYRAPSWFRSKATTGNLLWRVVALDRAGQYIGETEKRKFQIAR
jgi:hypothetical protein